MWTAERQLPGGNDSQWTGKKPKSQSNGLGQSVMLSSVIKKKGLCMAKCMMCRTAWQICATKPKQI